MPETNRSFATKPCHNCRRRRLRCDKSHPFCHKCSLNGQECLGYGQIIRWANAPAIRGKLAPVKPFPQTAIQPCLIDPLLNRLDSKSRNYMHHFTTLVCRDLVSIDQKDRNPFRAMIPLCDRFDYLEAIVVATGAMHLATLLTKNHDGTGGPELVDALVAKDRAIHLLKKAIETVTPSSQAMILAAVVFFVNLDLIDSGKGGWPAHIEAATALMSSLRKQQQSVLKHDSTLMSLVDVIAADCLTYRILGTTISTVDITSWGEDQDTEDGLFDVLRRAEAHSYHCCPPVILQVIMSTSRLSTLDDEVERLNGALELLERAMMFPVEEWVHSIRGLSLEEDDLSVRVSLASAHRAAACLYILLSAPEVEGVLEGRLTLDGLVQEVKGFLSEVPTDHILLKGTVWPMFMAGAQTDDKEQREWYLERLGTVWAKNPWICPWGYIRTAVEMLKELWAVRDKVGGERGKGWNWLHEMKARREKCLIV
ncbi:acriflavine sensitivity control protein acr-2 [Podospora fimiseda]|uniref:Acriflavine sensitivity control protein acr-2 n=1 Tax=Podospora fimiseda TaxID=252190 RepID=A0AAN7BHL0_9PEZI|nr:acriflavine sensitivity control protein acr-2 [Podospora fimiseda]